MRGRVDTWPVQAFIFGIQLPPRTLRPHLYFVHRQVGILDPIDPHKVLKGGLQSFIAKGEEEDRQSFYLCYSPPPVFSQFVLVNLV